MVVIKDHHEYSPNNFPHFVYPGVCQTGPGVDKMWKVVGAIFVVIKDHHEYSPNNFPHTAHAQHRHNTGRAQARHRQSTGTGQAEHRL